MANPFTYLELHTTDPARARAFYHELFGWKTKDSPIPTGGTYTEIDPEEGLQAGLMKQGIPNAPSAWLAYVRVPVLDESVRRAESLGARVLVPRTAIKDVGSFTILQDPTGAPLGLFEALPERAA